MESPKFPWKNLTSTMNRYETEELRYALMEVLQNFAQFSIDPNEVIDVSWPYKCNPVRHSYFRSLNIW